MRAAAAILLILMIAACSAGAPATPRPSSPALASPVAAPTVAISPTPTRAADLLSVRPVGFGGAPLGFLEYLPPDLGTGEQKPLLVFLHGSGEIGGGSEEELALVTKLGIPQLIDDDAWPSDRPFVVLSPQHADGEECALADEIDSFLVWAVPEYAADPERVYLTGISCGAIGVWDYLAVHGDEIVSAAVPVAAPLEFAWPKGGCDLGRVPVWIFHGEEDEIVPVTIVEDRVAELQACSPAPTEVRLTLLPGADHVESVTPPYDLSTGDDIYAWLLEQ